MIVITGSSGFVGSRLLKELDMYWPQTPLRAFDLRPPKKKLPERVNIFYGGVENSDDIKEVLNGAEVVVHLAGKVDPHSKDFNELKRINTEGTRMVFREAAAAGCKLFILVISAGIYGQPCKAEPFREDDTPQPVTPYQRSKWLAELAVQEEDAKGMILNIIRPAGLYGAGSLLEETAMYRKVLHQRYAINLRGGVVVHPTHAMDLIKGLIALIESPAAHQTVFNLGGQGPFLLQNLQSIIAEVLEVSRQTVEIPPWLATPLALSASAFFKVIGRKKPHLTAMARGEIFSAAVDDQRFRQAYPNVPIMDIRDGLREHINWLRESDTLK